MSTWSDPGNALYWPDSKPFYRQFQANLTAPATATFSLASYPGNTVVFLGIDVVITATATGQFNVAFSAIALANYFYYDSQSIGQGGGIRFQWRGMLGVAGSSNVQVQALLVGTSAVWAGTAWGIVLPFASSV
jgi:hypothetical protein